MSQDEAEAKAEAYASDFYPTPLEGYLPIRDAYLAGHRSRDAEVQALKSTIEHLRKENDMLVNTETWTVFSERDQAKAEVAALRAAADRLAEALKFYAEGWHYRIAEHEETPRDGVECTFEEGEVARTALADWQRVSGQTEQKHD